MHRSDRFDIVDPRSQAILASRWSLANAETQIAAAKACLAEMPEASGLVRYSIFSGMDDPILFHLAQWESATARDHYMQVLSAQPNAAVDAKVARILRDWREAAAPYRDFTSSHREQARCLVVLRQPLVKPDETLAHDWIDSVLFALKAAGGAPDGLCAAHFFVSRNSEVVLNLAEWVSADAHRAALRPVGTAGGNVASFGIGNSPEWQATRSHPGIASSQEIRRYELFAALEPGS
jgi:hypothetical protein